MPALIPTTFTARITYIGHVTDRDARLASDPLTSARLTFAGIAGEAHGGRTRPSCSRVLAMHPRDTEIANVRQLSVLCHAELADIAQRMGLETLPPDWLGASLVLEGLPDFTHLPPSSRLQAPDGATLVIDMANRPCNLPARVIEDQRPGFGAKFKAAARGRRGVTAWVEREGEIAVGQAMRLFVPDQRAWSHLGLARTGDGAEVAEQSML